MTQSITTFLGKEPKGSLERSYMNTLSSTIISSTSWGNRLSHLSFKFWAAIAGEGNGTPLQYSCLENPTDRGVWWAAVHGVTRCRMQLSDFTFTFHFHALEKEMATHSSVLVWRIPEMGEPGGLPSVGSHRVRHNWIDLAAAAAAIATCWMQADDALTPFWVESQGYEVSDPATGWFWVILWPLRTACAPICTTVESKWPLGFLPIVGFRASGKMDKRMCIYKKEAKRKQILVYFALGIACAIWLYGKRKNGCETEMLAHADNNILI